jgi:hypothetical protein
VCWKYPPLQFTFEVSILMTVETHLKRTVILILPSDRITEMIIHIIIVVSIMITMPYVMYPYVCTCEHKFDGISSMQLYYNKEH